MMLNGRRVCSTRRLLGVLALAACTSAWGAAPALADGWSAQPGSGEQDQGRVQTAFNDFDGHGHGHHPGNTPGGPGGGGGEDHGPAGGGPGGPGGTPGGPVQPVPEPGTMALAGMGLVAMAGAFRKRFAR